MYGKRACVAIDLGTSSCKAAIVDERLNILALESSPFETVYPQPRFAEQDPNEWWKATCEAVSAALSKAGDVHVESIVLSSQREGLVMLDEHFQPVKNAIIWIDRRAVAELEELLSEFGIDGIARITGVVPSAGFTAPLLRWVARREWEVFKRTAFITQPKGFLIARMTGEFAIDKTLAPRFSLADIWRMRYEEALLKWAGVSEWQLPRIVEPTEAVGGLTKTAASQLGLKVGTPVIAGMGDRQCETLGLALKPMEDVMVASGTAANISVLTNLTEVGLDPRVARGPHLNGLVQLEVGLWACGAVLNWLASCLKTDSTDMLDWIERACHAGSNAKSLIVLPFFAGASAPHWDAKVLACIIGLSLGHGNEDIVRATVEALAVEIAENVALYRSKVPTIKCAVHCGGLARLMPFNQAIADATELSIMLPRHHDAAVLGAACIGLSQFTGINAFELASKINPRVRVILPTEYGVVQMSLRRQLQKQAYEAIAPLMHTLHEAISMRD
ncbi:MAG: FGGY family carbohydrate kinase [Armatimonadota bacterium]|nr:FGGY family carbohydrate kinase [Armatimonadota bacterium]MCX7778518.1 FGGY family carbohydrate kinase [Armatimonadota bacterium]MDW8025044.1 FGGY family carbohydrate kinase [Armatimonadota bacterium]